MQDEQMQHGQVLDGLYRTSRTGREAPDERVQDARYGPAAAHGRRGTGAPVRAPAGGAGIRCGADRARGPAALGAGRHPNTSGTSPSTTGRTPQQTKAGREHSPSGRTSWTDSDSAARSARR